MRLSTLPTFYCSFCGSSQYEVVKLIAAPANSFICNRCVVQCVSLCCDPQKTSSGEVCPAFHRDDLTGVAMVNLEYPPELMLFKEPVMHHDSGADK